MREGAVDVASGALKIRVDHVRASTLHFGARQFSLRDQKYEEIRLAARDCFPLVEYSRHLQLYADLQTIIMAVVC